jgi:hypothetical protein
MRANSLTKHVGIGMSRNPGRIDSAVGFLQE